MVSDCSATTLRATDLHDMSDKEYDRRCYGAGDRCPYRGNKCPLDIPPDEEACCDNDYESCLIFIKLRANERYNLDD